MRYEVRLLLGLVVTILTIESFLLSFFVLGLDMLSQCMFAWAFEIAKSTFESFNIFYIFVFSLDMLNQSIFYCAFEIAE